MVNVEVFTKRPVSNLKLAFKELVLVVYELSRAMPSRDTLEHFGALLVKYASQHTVIFSASLDCSNEVVVNAGASASSVVPVYTEPLLRQQFIVKWLHRKTVTVKIYAT